MKKYSKFFAIAAVVAAGLIGCSKEAPDNGGQGSQVTEGSPTYATFTFEPESGPGTRAGLSNDNGTLQDVASLTSVRILVYAHNASNTGVCEVDTIITTSGSSTKSATVKTTSGQKRILIIANTHTGAVGSTPVERVPTFGYQVGSTLNSLVTTLATNGTTSSDLVLGSPGLPITAAPTSTKLTDLSLSKVVPGGTENFIFSNSMADSSSVKTLVGDIGKGDSESATPEKTTPTQTQPKNAFTIFVKRTVAKVNMKYDGSSWDTADGKGTLATAKWGVRNQNRATAIFQGTLLGEKPQQASFYDLVGTVLTGTALNDTNSFKPYWYSSGGTPEINIDLNNTDNKSYYIPENVVKNAVTGNVTYIAFSAQYKPKAGTAIATIQNDDSKFGISATTPNATDYSGTFYKLSVVSPTGAAYLNQFGRGYLQDAQLYTDLETVHKVAYLLNNGGLIGSWTSSYRLPANDPNFRIETFAGGLCYYRFNLTTNSTTAYYVNRNYAYAGRVQGFAGLGKSALDSLDLNPGTPLAVETHVTATIQVIPWDTSSFNTGIIQ
jgi:hypothetical protein